MREYRFDATGIDRDKLRGMAPQSVRMIWDHGIVVIYAPESIAAEVVSGWVADCTAPPVYLMTLEEEIDAILNRCKEQILQLVRQRTS